MEETLSRFISNWVRLIESIQFDLNKTLKGGGNEGGGKAGRQARRQEGEKEIAMTECDQQVAEWGRVPGRRSVLAAAASR